MSFGDSLGSGRQFGSASGSFGGPSGSSGAMTMRSMPRGADGDSNYVALNERVSSNITQITQNVISLQRMVGLLGTAKDTPEVRERMHTVQNATRRLAREAGQSIRQLGLIDGGSANEARSRKQQQQKLSSHLQTALRSFADVEKLAASKEKADVAKHRAHSIVPDSHSGHPGFDEDMSEDTRLLNDRQNQISALDNEVEYNEHQIEERERGIKEIESTIIEVNEIFKDLGAMINDQGQMLDSIEGNIDQVHSHVEQGREQLESAATYQKKARSKMICLLVIVLIVAGILTAVLVTQLK